MADIRRSVRDLFLQGVEAVNSAANQVVNATRTKVDEMNLRNRRKEVLDVVASTLYVYWMQGLVELPEALTEKLEELKDIDNQIAVIEQQSNKAEAPKETEEAPAPSLQVEEEPEAEAEAEDEEVPSISVEAAEEAVAAAEEAVETARAEVPTFNSLWKDTETEE